MCRMRGENRFDWIIEFDRFESENIKQSIGKEEEDEDDIRAELDRVEKVVAAIKSSLSSSSVFFSFFSLLLLLMDDVLRLSEADRSDISLFSSRKGKERGGRNVETSRRTENILEIDHTTFLMNDNEDEDNIDDDDEDEEEEESEEGVWLRREE